MTMTATHPTVKKYEEIFEIYTDTKSRLILSEVESRIWGGDMATAETMLRQFKTEDELLFELEEKLAGKPVYATLKKVRKGTIENKGQLLKGLFSLGTHACVECEKGRDEYVYIVRKIHERIGKLI